MRQELLTVLIGLVTGVLSGQFGIGGGLVTTPAIKLVLHRPDLIAVGTPLPVIIPTAAAGAVSYARRGLSDVRGGLAIGLWGAAATIVGAYGSRIIGGSIVLVLTAVVICYSAVEMMLSVRHDGSPPSSAESAAADTYGASHLGPPPRPLAGGGHALVGLLAGLYSGLLGLGGGFVIVPLLVRRFGFSAKRAIGTSLVAITVLAIPGSVAHYVLGNVDVELALLLSVGVVPGAIVGARVTAASKERSVRIAFAALLVLVGAVLGVVEIGGLA